MEGNSFKHLMIRKPTHKDFKILIDWLITEKELKIFIIEEDESSINRYLLFSCFCSASDTVNNEFLAHLGSLPHKNNFYTKGFLSDSFYKLILELDFKIM